MEILFVQSNELESVRKIHESYRRCWFSDNSAFSKSDSSASILIIIFITFDRFESYVVKIQFDSLKIIAFE